MRQNLFNYGYYWLGMKEVSYDFTIIYFKNNAIYKLYEDNTESLAESIDDIKRHYENGGKFGIELKKFDNYVVFALGRDYLKDILPYENDIAYKWCINIAKDFEISDFNNTKKDILSCLEKYLKENIHLDNGKWYFKNIEIGKVCE